MPVDHRSELTAHLGFFEGDMDAVGRGEDGEGHNHHTPSQHATETGLGEIIHPFEPSFRLTPWGLDHADDSLTAGMSVHVFHRDLLLDLAAVAIERRTILRMCGRAFRLGLSVHRRIVAGKELTRDHTFKCIPRPDFGHTGDDHVALLLAKSIIPGLIWPDRAKDPTGDILIPVVRLRSADVL
jgi:hypothetical protein